MTTLYRCDGSCKGVSNQPGSCQATDCELHGQPLTEVQQCKACAASASNDGALHACTMCPEC